MFLIKIDMLSFDELCFLLVDIQLKHIFYFGIPESQSGGQVGELLMERGHLCSKIWSSVMNFNNPSLCIKKPSMFAR